MNRRSFFKFAAFTATANVLDFGLNELQAIPPEPDHSELINLIGYLKTQHKIICLGDTNHTDINVASALKSVALAKGLSREGFSNLFIEYPVDKAQPFQDYQAKTINREDFIEALINNGGLSGWLSSVILSSNLRLLPHFVAGPLMVLMLLGWAGWKSAAGAFATLLQLGYGLAFMLAGRPDNYYWGAMVAPTLAMGLAWAPMALRGLATAAR